MARNNKANAAGALNQPIVREICVASNTPISVECWKCEPDTNLRKTGATVQIISETAAMKSGFSVCSLNSGVDISDDGCTYEHRGSDHQRATYNVWQLHTIDTIIDYLDRALPDTMRARVVFRCVGGEWEEVYA